MKLILQFLKRITLFSNNKFNVSKDNNTSLPKSKKKNLSYKNKEGIVNFKERSPQSFELQRKLALLISNIDKIDKKDFQKFEYTRYSDPKEDGLLIGYRIDFRHKDDLEDFKEKYKEYLI